jgi:hypothetical protein
LFILRAFPPKFKIKVVVDSWDHPSAHPSKRDFYIDIAGPSYHNEMTFLGRRSDEKENISQVGNFSSSHPLCPFGMCREGEGCQNDFRRSGNPL